jgi:Transmembrane domain of unknown function (DUF3566)
VTQADQTTRAESGRGTTGRTATAQTPQRAGRPPQPPVSDGSGSAGRPSGRSGGPTATRGPRSARLVLRRVEPFSVLKLALLLAVAGVITALVLVSILYGVLHAMGVFDTVGSFSTDIGATTTSKLITYKAVAGWTAVISAVVAIFGAALATIAAYVYNGVNEFVGGPEITFTERS